MGDVGQGPQILVQILNGGLAFKGPIGAAARHPQSVITERLNCQNYTRELVYQ